MFFNWVMENPMYVSALLLSVAFVIAAYRYILNEDNSSNEGEGGQEVTSPDFDLPLPDGVSPPVDDEVLV